ncbi:fumarylacetoacetate hydrolase family protein [Solimonas terrae]|uniref:Fumarylacetoacetate hydrolase family protein n=1 Tax=Solimonas terrae TaxID=1396819 RepID=A0A6M2BKE7_9GAMM|nr:fumarylacetoacetate hydrolase family protein [Solimonas terrae]NGY03322.1 fumarylacetoacetate hydrolase family protein [Solimonas terrae]
MKFVSFRHGGADRFGVFKKDAIVPLSEDADLKSLLAAGPAALQAAEKEAAQSTGPIALAHVELLPPIPNPGTIWCAGMNTHSHYDEAREHMKLHDKPAKPILFIRSTATLVGSGRNLEKPKLDPYFDYEGEIAIVIGAHVRNVAVDQAMACIAGYACFNDASARAYQLSSNQITAGKNAWRSGGFGPCLVTPDEVDLASMTMVCRLNGTEMQRMKIDDLIFGFAELVSFISEFTWLVPGDVIVTGSPAGIGALRKPPVLLKAGDTVEVEVSGVGTLVNGVQNQP